MPTDNQLDGDDMTREQIIDHLVANCDAWGYDEDRTVLSMFNDEKLGRLKALADNSNPQGINQYTKGRGKSAVSEAHKAAKINPDSHTALAASRHAAKTGLPHHHETAARAHESHASKLEKQAESVGHSMRSAVTISDSRDPDHKATMVHKANLDSQYDALAKAVKHHRAAAKYHREAASPVGNWGMTANCDGDKTCPRCKARAETPTEEDEEKNTTANGVVVTVNTAGVTKMTTEEYLKTTNAPPEVVAAVQNSVRVVNQAKSRIVDGLVANVKDETKRKSHIDLLMKKDLTELEMELERMPAPATTDNHGQWDNGYIPPAPNYAGAAGGTYVGNGSYGQTDDEVLLPPTINWADGFDPAKVA